MAIERDPAPAVAVSQGLVLAGPFASRTEMTDKQRLVGSNAKITANPMACPELVEGPLLSLRDTGSLPKPREAAAAGHRGVMRNLTL